MRDRPWRNGVPAWLFAFPRRLPSNGVSARARLVELVACGEQVVIRKKKYDLSEMLAKVSPENLHSEVDFGPPTGREEW